MLVLGSVDLLFKNASNLCESDEIPGWNQVAKVEFVPGIQISLAVLWNWKKMCFFHTTEGRHHCRYWVEIHMTSHDQNLFPQRFCARFPHFAVCIMSLMGASQISTLSFPPTNPDGDRSESHRVRSTGAKGAMAAGIFLVATLTWFIFDDDSIKQPMICWWKWVGSKNCWSILYWLYCHHKIMWYNIMPYTSNGMQFNAMQCNMWWNMVSLQLQYRISWHLRYNDVNRCTQLIFLLGENSWICFVHMFNSLRFTEGEEI